MLVKVDISSLRRIRPHEYASRFLFGGAVTVATGLIAKHYGPAIGGMFLAFPAIFPASVSLVAKKEKQKKERAGIEGENRGRVAAGIEATGATMGCVGLATFAVVVAALLPGSSTAFAFMIGTMAWALVACTVFLLRKRGRRWFRRPAWCSVDASEGDKKINKW